MSNRFRLSGVYKITNKINDKFYIGSGNSVFNRWFSHSNNLINNSHVNCKLQRAVNKYGIENFKFEVIELHPPEGLNLREQFYLDSLCMAQEYIKGTSTFFNQNTYNIKPLVEGTTGLPLKDERIIRSVRSRGFEKIYKISNKGEFIKEYELQLHAADDNQMSRTTVARSLKTNKCPKGRSFYFVYENSYDKNHIPKDYEVHNKGVKGVVKGKNIKSVFVYDIYGRFFKKFVSGTAAAKYFNVGTSCVSAKMNKQKLKTLHRHGIHLYNFFSQEMDLEKKLNMFKFYKDDGKIEVYSLFHEYMGSYDAKTISEILRCHLSSVYQAETQNKILKGFYFIKEE